MTGPARCDADPARDRMLADVEVLVSLLREHPDVLPEVQYTWATLASSTLYSIAEKAAREIKESTHAR